MYVLFIRIYLVLTCHVSASMCVVAGVVLSQFDGLVEGYGRSRCFPQAPLSSIDLLVLQVRTHHQGFNHFVHDQKHKHIFMHTDGMA